MKIRFGNDKNKHVQIKMARPKRVKTCEGCSALIDGDARSGFSCYLGYTLDSIKGIPIEKCPKPRSNTKMVELHIAGKRASITPLGNERGMSREVHGQQVDKEA